MNKNIALIYGDCSSPEIVHPGQVRVLDKIAAKHGHAFTYTRAYMGGEAIDKFGDPAAGVGAGKMQGVGQRPAGGHRWSQVGGHAPVTKRPEKGLLRLRAGMGLYANNRPAKIWPQLAAASPLKAEIVGQRHRLHRGAGTHRRCLLRRTQNL